MRFSSAANSKSEKINSLAISIRAIASSVSSTRCERSDLKGTTDITLSTNSFGVSILRILRTTSLEMRLSNSAYSPNACSKTRLCAVNSAVGSTPLYGAVCTVTEKYPSSSKNSTTLTRAKASNEIFILPEGIFITCFILARTPVVLTSAGLGASAAKSFCADTYTIESPPTAFSAALRLIGLFTSKFNIV